MNHQKILGVLGGDHMTSAKVGTWIESADIVIAADGGMLRVLESGYIPDVVIGDFDSMSLEIVGPETETIVDRNQDWTDCAKLLNYVHSQGFTQVTLVCAEGDLSDHFIDTLHCSIRSNLEVTIGLERGIAHILKGPVKRDLSAEPGKRVSLLPMESVQNASLSGVQWPFESKQLSVRGFTSISNMATNERVQVSFDQGSAYLFIESDQITWTHSSENLA